MGGVVGLVGYKITNYGLKQVTTVWAEHLNEELKRRFYKNWYKSKKKAFTKYAKKYADGQAEINEQLEKVKSTCAVVRAIVHTQIRKLMLGQKKAHMMEVHINGGDMAAKVDFCVNLFEKQ